MRVPHDARFRAQRAGLVLLFTCEHCAMFDPEHGAAKHGWARRRAVCAAGSPDRAECGVLSTNERERCAHGYPTDEHRFARYEEGDAPLVFCKEWELA